ncbi:hypothetical protein DFS34DRAFT_620013 [Phlyctochytrium arcticum]|nr:hypothetical protein DFS34DRAFT_620013 [Phlyctochytrium arcticum]
MVGVSSSDSSVLCSQDDDEQNVIPQSVMTLFGGLSCSTTENNSEQDEDDSDQGQSVGGMSCSGSEEEGEEQYEDGEVIDGFEQDLRVARLQDEEDDDYDLPMDDEEDSDDPTIAAYLTSEALLLQPSCDPATSDYAIDIYATLLETETTRLPDPDYMPLQSDLSWAARSALTVWLIQVHAEYRLRPETLHGTIQLLDRVCSVRLVSRQQYQLLGLTCLWLVAKFEENHGRVPPLKNLGFICMERYRPKDFIRTERLILRTIGWELTGPSCETFLRSHCRVIPHGGCRSRAVARYFMEVATVVAGPGMIGVRPSVVARAALTLSETVMGRGDVVPFVGNVLIGMEPSSFTSRPSSDHEENQQHNITTRTDEYRYQSIVLTIPNKDAQVIACMQLMTYSAARPCPVVHAKYAEDEMLGASEMTDEWIQIAKDRVEREAREAEEAARRRAALERQLLLLGRTEGDVSGQSDGTASSFGSSPPPPHCSYPQTTPDTLTPSRRTRTPSNPIDTPSIHHLPGDYGHHGHMDGLTLITADAPPTPTTPTSIGPDGKLYAWRQPQQQTYLGRPTTRHISDIHHHPSAAVYPSHTAFLAPPPPPHSYPIPRRPSLPPPPPPSQLKPSRPPGLFTPPKESAIDILAAISAQARPAPIPAQSAAAAAWKRELWTCRDDEEDASPSP